MERSVAIGATSGSLSALVLRLASELLSAPLPADCPLCADCLDLSIFTLGSLDLPSVALGICIGVLAGPLLDLCYLLRASWRSWVRHRLDQLAKGSYPLYRLA